MSAIQPEQPRARKPALKLVKTQDLSRDDWLAVRRTGIGGSDAAAAVGLNPYMSALELWLDKTGRAEGLPRPDLADTTSPTYWGTLLEPIVAAVYTQQTGNRVRKVNAVLRHPSIPFMLANIDREIVGARDVQILECKTAGEFGARLWRDGVPEYVQVQVQHQLAVTGKSAAHVAVLLCGQALEVFLIERDDALIGRLVELEARFWQFVQSDTPPLLTDRSRQTGHCGISIQATAARSISAMTGTCRRYLPIWLPCGPTSKRASRPKRGSNRPYSRQWATPRERCSRPAKCRSSAARIRPPST